MVRKEIGKNPSILGRAIVKAKALNKYEARRDGRQKTAHYHNTDDADEEERNNLQSIMERNDLDEFLNQAMMKEQDFSAQRANVVIVGGSTVVQVANKEIKEQLEYEHIRVPRRPRWDFKMSGDELQRLEREAFLAWRRDLAVYEEGSVDKHATPFEKNIEVWKQLWRVVERSHVVAQIVDARNPLLYYCQDLFTLAKELDPRKACVLVINKSDFLTREAREQWGRYLDSQGVQYIFWSALKETELQQSEEEKRVEREAAREERRSARREIKRQALIDEIRAKNATSKVKKTGIVTKKMSKLNINKSAFAGLEDDDDEDDEVVEEEYIEEDDEEEDIEIDEALIEDDDDEEDEELVKPVEFIDLDARDPYEVVGHQELLEFFRSFGHPGYILETYEQNREHRAKAQKDAEENVKRGGRIPEHHDLKDEGEKVIIGMLGFPNVGKSSTINALVGAKKVSVSSTAGHTKHFQTLNLGDGLVLCDCPGLVFPTFVHSKASLVINGVLPIDTLRDFISPVEAICQRISRSQIIQEYGLDIPAWKQLDAMTLLTSYARLRGYYKNAGRPDETRSARIMLKDYVAGKLLHCQCPPGLTPEQRTSFYASFAEENGAAPTAAPVPVPVNGIPIKNNPLAFEEETGMMFNTGERSDVINVNVSRKKVVTVQPETEQLSVYETRTSKQEKLKDLAARSMTKKQLMRMRNSMRKGHGADLLGEGDITKKGSAGTNTSKFFGSVFENGKRVKQ